MAPRDLPSGTLTFLFTDIEGSTRLLRDLGDAYADQLADHRRLLREAFARHNGFEVGTEGDSFFVVFASAAEAVSAAAEAQAALERGPVRVRMGMHTGVPVISEGDYVGLDVHLAARIAASGHGGQIVLSAETRSPLSDSFSFLDLGEHRLKDFDEPVRLFQLGEGRFPPLRTISNTNLPRPASSFVGREREIAEVVSLLKNGARLVSLTGPGGSGKTRLAIEAAAELVPEFKAGVFWVGLAPLRDPALVTETIEQTLGAKEGLPTHIGEREMLLLLDNFEQVVESATDFSPLLAGCPNLRLLVTTRELLRVQGEVEYAVLPLAQTEAVELFRARSGLQPDKTIAELCRSLDYLPLAVELAAARTSVLSPAQILERLSKRLDLLRGGRDADPRQATLRATIEWSYDLLSDQEKSLFARLAAFAGGCTLESAEEVAGADLDILQSLVNKSLVRRTQDRFWMLETVRDYALECLDASGEADSLRLRHAEHFLALAEEAEPHLFGGRPEEWRERLEGEHDNLRASLDFLASCGETQLVLRFAGALAEFWGVKGHLVEGRRRLESALATDERGTTARAKALNGAADLATGTGEIAMARLRAEEGLALHRKLGNIWGSADSLLLIGIAANNEGDFVRARGLIEESVRLFGEIGAEHNSLEATRMLAWTYGGLGNTDGAQALLEKNLRRARWLGNRHIEATSLEGLAGYATDEGRAQDALRLLEDAYRLNCEIGDNYRIPFIVCRFGHALAAAGRAEMAARVLSSGLALLEAIGAGENWIERRNEETLAIIRQQIDDATLTEAWEQGRRLPADGAVALSLEALDAEARETQL